MTDIVLVKTMRLIDYALIPKKYYSFSRDLYVVCLGQDDLEDPAADPVLMVESAGNIHYLWDNGTWYEHQVNFAISPVPQLRTVHDRYSIGELLRQYYHPTLGDKYQVRILYKLHGHH